MSSVRAGSMKQPFRELDLALKIANEQGIRLIIPLVDNWKWQGGTRRLRELARQNQG